MNEDWREREADLRSEYEAEATYEAADDCDHVNYNLVDIFFYIQCRICEPCDKPLCKSLVNSAYRKKMLLE